MKACQITNTALINAFADIKCNMVVMFSARLRHSAPSSLGTTDIDLATFIAIPCKAVLKASK